MLRVTYLDVSPLLDGARYRSALSLLSPARQEKAECFRFPRDRALSVGAGLLLDDALRELGLRERDQTYSLGAFGKPCFADVPELHFSVSHSGTVVLAAFADREVGCDVEQVEPAKEGVARRFFHPEELAAWLSLPEEERALAFYRLWTCEESVMKATGQGLSLSPERFLVRPSPDGAVAELPGGTYAIRAFSPLPGYAAACSMQGSCPPVTPAPRASLLD